LPCVELEHLSLAMLQKRHEELKTGLGRRAEDVAGGPGHSPPTCGAGRQDAEQGRRDFVSAGHAARVIGRGDDHLGDDLMRSLRAELRQGRQVSDIAVDGAKRSETQLAGDIAPSSVVRQRQQMRADEEPTAPVREPPSSSPAQ
jgi:hypothetical protein